MSALTPGRAALTPGRSGQSLVSARASVSARGLSRFAPSVEWTEPAPTPGMRTLAESASAAASLTRDAQNDYRSSEDLQTADEPPRVENGRVVLTASTVGKKVCLTASAVAAAEAQLEAAAAAAAALVAMAGTPAPPNGRLQAFAIDLEDGTTARFLGRPFDHRRGNVFHGRLQRRTGGSFPCVLKVGEPDDDRLQLEMHMYSSHFLMDDAMELEQEWAAGHGIAWPHSVRPLLLPYCFRTYPNVRKLRGKAKDDPVTKPGKPCTAICMPHYVMSLNGWMDKVRAYIVPDAATVAPSPTQALRMLVQLVTALEIMHNEVGVVLGDIKPMNLVFDENFHTLRIIDLEHGLATPGFRCKVRSKTHTSLPLCDLEQSWASVLLVFVAPYIRRYHLVPRDFMKLDVLASNCKQFLPDVPGMPMLRRRVSEAVDLIYSVFCDELGEDAPVRESEMVVMPGPPIPWEELDKEKAEMMRGGLRVTTGTYQRLRNALVRAIEQWELANSATPLTADLAASMRQGIDIQAPLVLAPARAADGRNDGWLFSTAPLPSDRRTWVFQTKDARDTAISDIYVPVVDPASDGIVCYLDLSVGQLERFPEPEREALPHTRAVGELINALMNAWITSLKVVEAGLDTRAHCALSREVWAKARAVVAAGADGTRTRRNPLTRSDFSSYGLPRDVTTALFEAAAKILTYAKEAAREYKVLVNESIIGHDVPFVHSVHAYLKQPGEPGASPRPPELTPVTTVWPMTVHVHNACLPIHGFALVRRARTANIFPHQFADAPEP